MNAYNIVNITQDSLEGVSKYFHIRRGMYEPNKNLDSHVILEPWTLRAPDSKIMQCIFNGHEMISDVIIIVHDSMLDVANHYHIHICLLLSFENKLTYCSTLDNTWSFSPDLAM